MDMEMVLRMGWGDIAVSYTQEWRQTFKIELKTTRYRNRNLVGLNLRQTSKAFRVPALLSVLHSLHFNDTPTEEVLELENHKTGRSRKDMLYSSNSLLQQLESFLSFS
jgi:hypothetical protein